MLNISNINVYYGDLQALWDVSLAVEEGKIVTLVGSNGAGKSTLMHALTGLIKPKTGSIALDGRRIDKMQPHKIVSQGICMVPEGRRLFPHMTILENLEIGSTVKTARKEKEKTIKWIYELFPVLAERKKQKAGTLSGGEQQMLAIGRSLMSRPKLLLIDEMSLGLSPLVTQMIAETISKLNDSLKLTIVLVEQDVQLALSIAHEGYIIENGRIVGHGDAAKLLCSEEIKEAYLGMGKAD